MLHGSKVLLGLHLAPSLTLTRTSHKLHLASGPHPHVRVGHARARLQPRGAAALSLQWSPAVAAASGGGPGLAVLAQDGAHSLLAWLALGAGANWSTLFAFPVGAIAPEIGVGAVSADGTALMALVLDDTGNNLGVSVFDVVAATERARVPLRDKTLIAVDIVPCDDAADVVPAYSPHAWPAAPLTPPELVAAIVAAAASRAAGYTAPAGAYNFSAYPGLSLTLVGATDFYLDLSQALLLFNPSGGLTLRDCERVHVAGATIDAWPVPFAQSVGPMTDVVVYPAPAGHSPTIAFTMALAPGFPSPRDLAPRGSAKTYWWDAASLALLHSQVQTSPEMLNASETADGRWRVFSRLPLTLKGWTPPESALVTLSPSTGAAVLVVNCSGTRVDDFTVHASAGMGYLEAGGGGGTVLQRWRAVRAPGRLLATNLDGVHSTSVQHGLALLDSEVSFAADDAFAVHCELGIAWGVTPAPAGDELYIIDTGGAVAPTVAAARPGDALYFFALNETMDPLLGSRALTVAAVAVEANATLQAQAAQASADIARERGVDIRSLTGVTLLLRVRFDAPLPAALRARFAAMVMYAERCGRGTAIRRTTLRDSSGGARLKGVNVTVDSSHIENVYGLRMLPEIFWTQSISMNITVTNNVFVGTGNAPAAPDSIAYVPDTCTGLVLANNSITPAPPPLRG